MTARLRYGPRFGGSVQNIRRGYDPALDAANWGRRPFDATQAGTPEALMRSAKAKTTAEAKRQLTVEAKLRAQKGCKTEADLERERIDATAIETIKAAVGALEFALEALNDAPPFTVARVNRNHVFKGLGYLKKSYRDR